MLDLSTPPVLVAGLSAFRDHAETDLLRLLPDRVRVADEVEPLLSLVLYRTGVDDPDRGGGLIQLEVELAPTAAQVHQLRSTLPAQERPWRLVPPDWVGGQARLVGWLSPQDGALQPLELASARPSLAGWPRVLIAALLDAPAASLAVGALRGDALPTGVVLALELQGLAGRLDVVAEADLAAVHERLTAAGALTTPVARATLSATWEELLRDQAVRIQVLDASGDVESRRAEAVRRIGEDLTSRLLTPVLPPEAPPLLADGTVAPVELSFRLTTRREELATTTRWEWTERRATTFTHYASAMLTDLLAGRDPLEVITRLDLGDRDEQPLRLVLLGSAPAAGLLAVEVEVARAGRASTDIVVLTPADPEALLDLDPGEGVRYRFRPRFDPALTRRPEEPTAWHELGRDWVLPVDPGRLFPPRRLRVLTVGAFHDAVVTLSAPGDAPHTVSLDPGTPSTELVVPDAQDTPLEIVTRWRGWPGGVPVTVTTSGITEDQVFLRSPFDEPTEVTFLPVFEDGVVAITVEVLPGPGSWASPTTATWEADQRDPVDVEVRHRTGTATGLPYRVTVVRADGATTTELPAAQGSFVVVGSDRAVERRLHRVGSVLGGAARGQALLLELHATAGDLTEVVLVDDDRPGVVLELVVPEGATPTDLLVRAHLPSGELQVTDIAAIGTTTLLPPEATGGAPPPPPPPPPPMT